MSGTWKMPQQMKEEIAEDFTAVTGNVVTVNHVDAWEHFYPTGNLERFDEASLPKFVLLRLDRVRQEQTQV